MDVRTWFLREHDAVHGNFTLSRLTDDQLRVTLPGHNSVAWFLWHVTRAEDLSVNAMLRGVPELITQGSWRSRLRVDRLDYGAGMTPEEVETFSNRVDLDVLRDYRATVRATTRAWAETFNFDDLDRPIDVTARLAHAPEALGSGSEAVRALFERMPDGWYWARHGAIGHSLQHAGDMEHVARLVRGDGTGPV